MLRASATRTDRPLNLAAVTDPTQDSQLEWGRELLVFTDAALARNRAAMRSAREALKLVAGPEAVVRAAGCAGNFQIMNRLMDTLGVPVSRAGLALAEELGLDLPDHLMPVPGTT